MMISSNDEHFDHDLFIAKSDFSSFSAIIYEPPCEKTGLRGFRPGPTQTGLYSHRRWLEAGNFAFRK